MKDLAATGVAIPLSKVVELERAMRCMDPIDIPVKHHFSQGVYAREITIPAGVTLVGKIHKFQQLNILSKGQMLVTTDDGVRRVKAPFTVVSPPGTKRAAYALTECVWTTIHGTDETDVDIIEAQYIAADEAAYLKFVEYQKCLGLL